MTAPPADLADALRDRYLLEHELGAGGMATVYLAQDLRHHRKVALKVLRPELAAVIGAKRFLQEIETTANLQHPHILPLYDSGEVGGTAFYVMPHVEGESLRDRLVREKQLPITAAVGIATEVASALDYAHRKGVIHRDIKPENILLHEGQALVADFGIALAATAAGGSRITETGMSLGTPHYMSPEQAMGEREITARSDVYALGCVVYEMLTGDPPFTGPSAQAIVARVLTEAPRPLIPQRHTIPGHIESAVLTALEKLPADRFPSATEFAQALASPGARTVVAATMPVPRGSGARLAWSVSGGLLLLLLGGTAYHVAGGRPTPRPLVASLLPPAGCEYEELSSSNLVQLSPDGRTLAFVATCTGDRWLWVRSLETGENRKLDGTAGSAYPFWSPDGRSLGFFADERLKRVDLESGAVRDLAPAPDGRGGAWNRSGTILYAPDIYGPLFQVAAGGGEPQPATAAPDSLEEVSHRNVYFLPDGRQFLFSQGRGTDVSGELRRGRLGSLESRKLIDRASNVAYAEGYLLYARDGVLLARPFDPDAAEPTGSALAVAPTIESFGFRYLANFSVSNGRLVYREPAILESRMEWFDPATGGRASIVDRGPYAWARLSPDGRRLLVLRLEGRGPLTNVWLYEPEQGAWSRLSGEAKLRYEVAWSREGAEAIMKQVGDSTMHVISLVGGESRSVTVPPGDFPVLDWAPDGSYAVGRHQVRTTGEDLIRWTLGRDTVLSVLYATPADEMDPRVSPNGRYLSYASDQSGRFEVYVARLPAMTGHVQVSFAGAQAGVWTASAVWSRDGRTLYYLDGAGTLLSVPVATDPVLRIGKPLPVAGAPRNIRAFDVAPNGHLLLLYDDHTTAAPLTLIENWTALIKHQ